MTGAAGQARIILATRNPGKLAELRRILGAAEVDVTVDDLEDVPDMPEVAETDMNVVCTGDGRFVEVQGTAEGVPFTRSELDELLSLAEHGIASLLDYQAALLAEPPPPRS